MQLYTVGNQEVALKVMFKSLYDIRQEFEQSGLRETLFSMEISALQLKDCPSSYVEKDAVQNLCNIVSQGAVAILWLKECIESSSMLPCQKALDTIIWCQNQAAILLPRHLRS